MADASWTSTIAATLPFAMPVMDALCHAFIQPPETMHAAILPPAGSGAAAPVSCCMPGLYLYENLISPDYQQTLLQFVEDQLEAGRLDKLPGKTFTKPSVLWAKLNKSREMLQYGVYTNSNRVQHTVEVMPLPPILEVLVDYLVEKGVFRECERPDTCVVNVYSKGMWLPPHVDSEVFARPFCTLSLLSDQDVVFGDEITGSEGYFEGEVRVHMKRGSVIRLGGRAAGPVCNHAIPQVSERRISITMRRLSQEAKYQFAADEAARQERKRQKWLAKKQAKADAALKKQLDS